MFEPLKFYCICVNKNQHRSTNEGSRTMTMFFLIKNSHCNLDLGPRILKHKLFHGIVILHIHVKLYKNQSLSEGTRAMALFSFLRTATVALTLVLERSNSNLIKIPSGHLVPK